jgi:hypothetical protein
MTMVAGVREGSPAHLGERDQARHFMAPKANIALANLVSELRGGFARIPAIVWFAPDPGDNRADHLWRKRAGGDPMNSVNAFIGGP